MCSMKRHSGGSPGHTMVNFTSKCNLRHDGDFAVTSFCGFDPSGVTELLTKFHRGISRDISWLGWSEVLQDWGQRNNSFLQAYVTMSQPVF